MHDVVKPASAAAKARAAEHIKTYGNSALYSATVGDEMHVRCPLTGAEIPEEKRIAVIYYEATPHLLSLWKSGKA